MSQTLPILSDEEVKLMNVYGKDFYPELSKSNVQIYTSLNYRHWDTWEDGKFSHIFIARNKPGALAIDIMEAEPFDCPQKPFGGEEEAGIKGNFPADMQTSETALLFLQLIMRRLKRPGHGSEHGGRAAVVVPNGTLSGDGVCARIKEQLLKDLSE